MYIIFVGSYWRNGGFVVVRVFMGEVRVEGVLRDTWNLIFIMGRENRW